MSRSFPLVIVLAVSAVAPGCATAVDETGGAPAGKSDAATDSKGGDAAPVEDSASPTDTGTSKDSGSSADSGIDEDTGSAPDDTGFPPPPDSGPTTTSFDGGFPDGFSTTPCTADGDCKSPFNCCDTVFTKTCGFKSGSYCFPPPPSK